MLSNEEINQYIHTQIMGECWHIDIGKTLDDEECKCGFTASLGCLDSYNPDYCSDKSPRSLLHNVVSTVVERSGEESYWHELRRIVPAYPVATPIGLCQATAEQIARACVQVHQNL